MKRFFTFILLPAVLFLFSTYKLQANDSFITASIPSGTVFINELMATNTLSYVNSSGEYEDWIEIYNSGSVPIDLAGCYITDDISNINGRQIHTGDAVTTTIPAKGYLIFLADENPEMGADHLNFKLGRHGESIYLVDSDGVTIIDSVTFGEQLRDITFNRFPDGSLNWGYSSEPTPGSTNLHAYKTVVGDINIEQESGLYSGSIAITVKPQRAGEQIRYTLDGSLPNQNSSLYTVPVNITATSIFSARAFKEGSLPSQVIAKSFLINEPTKLPVITLMTDPLNLYDQDKGILVNDFDGRQWERYTEMEYFKDSKLMFHSPAGIRVQGNTGPKDFDKKSLRIYFRDDYGTAVLNYPLYGNSKVGRFSRLVLRSGYDDNLEPNASNGTLVRDQLVTELFRQAGEFVSHSSYAVLYLNNNYNGIYDIKESIDENFIKDHNGYNNVDIIRTRWDSTEVTFGDKTEWNKLINFFQDNTFTDDSKINEAEQILDVDNYINLQALIYGTEYMNWGYGVSFYKEKTSQGKWKTVIWDSDRAYSDLSWDPLVKPYSPTGIYLTNLITKKLLQNVNVTNKFVNRICDLLNTVFLPTNVKNIIDSLAGVIQNEILSEAARWGSTYETWNENVSYLKNFAEQRPDTIRRQLNDYFSLNGNINLTVNISEGGKVKINTIVPDTYPFSGKYFSGIPVEITAVADAGYKFNRWSETSLPTNEKIIFTPDTDIVLSAIFEKLEDTNVELIVPSRIRSGQRLPFITRIRDEKWEINPVDQTPVQIKFENGHADTLIKIKRGAGSGLAEISSSAGFTMSAGNYKSGYFEKYVEVSSIPITEYSGTIQSGDIIWDNSAERLITSDLTIPSGTRLIIKPGTWIYVKKNVNLIIRGSIEVQGTKSEPVVITSDKWDEPWGGMEFRDAEASFKYCIVLNGGGDPSKGQPTNEGWHTGRQHIFFGRDNSEFYYDNCFFMFSPGKVFGLQDSKISITNSLTSFVWHGGEFHRVLLFYQDSHLMNLPNDDHIYTEDIDTDGMHIDYVNSNYPEFSVIDRCYFITGKDDAIDHHGSRLKITNCWLEDFIHEGVAASGRDTLVIFNTIAIKNGQGFEAGWKDDGVTKGPILFIDHCVAADNDAGLRVGDSYSWNYRSFMKVTNTVLYNNKDNILNYLNSTHAPLDSAIEISYSMPNDSDYSSYPHNIAGIPAFNDYYYLTSSSPGSGLGTMGTNMGRIDSSALLISPVVINEIMYNSPGDMNSKDWIELYNPQSGRVDLSNWVLKDDDDAHSFIIPEGSSIQPGEFLILCSDTSDFKNIHPSVYNILGNFSFGFGSEDKVRLISPAGEVADSVKYKNNNPWPPEADGQGYSLELLNYRFDNSKSENWVSSRIFGGTPGNINTLTSSPSENDEIIPSEYLLMQNYPNPFNPVTTIRYSLPVNTMVQIKLYDILGRELNVLVNEEQDAGNYQLIFNGESLASGIYIYRMSAGKFASSKKLILIK